MGVTVEVLGPNLFGEAKQLHVHAAGCADIKRRRSYRNADRGWKFEAESIVDIVMAIYPVEEFLYDPATELEIYESDIEIFPCVTGLPHEVETDRPDTDDGSMRDYACEVCGSTWRGYPESMFAGVCFHCEQSGKEAPRYRKTVDEAPIVPAPTVPARVQTRAGVFHKGLPTVTVGELIKGDRVLLPFGEDRGQPVEILNVRPNPQRSDWVSVRYRIGEASATLQAYPYTPVIPAPETPKEGTMTETKKAAPATETPAPARQKAEKFMECPLCGFKFNKPQAKCVSPAACAKRQAARTGTPAPAAAEPVFQITEAGKEAVEELAAIEADEAAVKASAAKKAAPSTEAATKAAAAKRATKKAADEAAKEEAKKRIDERAAAKHAESEANKKRMDEQAAVKAEKAAHALPVVDAVEVSPGHWETPADVDPIGA